MRQQVAPLANGQAAHGHAAYADALHRLDLQAHTLAEEGDLARALALERKAQALFALPADLGRAKLLAISPKK